MRSIRMSARGVKILTALGSLLTGIIMLGFSIVVIALPDAEYAETTGTIVNIEEYRDMTSSNNDIMHRVFVDYTADGKDYKNAEYGSYSSSMEIGDEVTVLYNVDEPKQIQAPGFEKVPYIVGGVGIVVLLCGVVALIKALGMRG